MRLEVIIDDDQPLFFPFNKKLVIGSDPTCDIVIEHPEVSKKHVSVYPEDDRFYIIDQGSRNGTYLNDERLIPGKKIEFTSFFPVRLGTSILISLISGEEEIAEPTSIEIPIPPTPRGLAGRSSGDATTVISLKDLQSAKTENLVKKKVLQKKKIEKKEPPKKKKKKSSIGLPQITAFLIVAGAYGIHHWSKTDEVIPAPGTSTKTTASQSVEDRTKVEAYEAAITPTGGDILSSLLNKDKGCHSEAERALCDNLKDLHYLRFTDKGADILVEFAPYAEKAMAILKEYDKKKQKIVEHDPLSLEVAQVATAVYYVENLARFPQMENPEAVLTLGFVSKVGEIQTLSAVAAFNVSLLPSLVILLNQQRLEAMKNNGVSVLDFGRFYQVWNKEKILWKGPGTSEPKALTPSEPETSPTSEPTTIDSASTIGPGTTTSPVPENTGTMPDTVIAPTGNSP